MVLNAVSQVEVDEILVGNPRLLGQILEITDDVHAEADGHLLLQVLGVRVLAALQFAQFVLTAGLPRNRI